MSNGYLKIKNLTRNDEGLTLTCQTMDLGSNIDLDQLPKSDLSESFSVRPRCE